MAEFLTGSGPGLQARGEPGLTDFFSEYSFARRDAFEVFAEVARVLQPGGRFIVTFSHRWFPEKVIRIWEELHEFERMGLILEYFHQSGQLNHLHTDW